MTWFVPCVMRKLCFSGGHPLFAAMWSQGPLLKVMQRQEGTERMQNWCVQSTEITDRVVLGQSHIPPLWNHPFHPDFCGDGKSWLGVTPSATASPSCPSSQRSKGSKITTELHE